MGPTNILLRNLFSLFAPTLLALAGTYLINHYTPLFTSIWIWGIVFFLSTGFILNGIYTWRWRYKEFTQLLFVCLVLKLVLAFIFIFVFSFIETKFFFNFAVHFLTYFVFYTIFEIRFILSLLKMSQAKPNTYAK